MSVAQEAVNFLADLHEGNNKEYLRATLAEQDKVFNLLRNPDLKEREAEWKEALTGQGGFLLNGLAPNGPRRRTVDDIIDKELLTKQRRSIVTSKSLRRWRLIKGS